ncbi:MAG: hypothetical protein LC130_19820 [Bryobacterales bacterium]|nr:hypothetical protein [Bryobacterales bacterium]
MPLPDTIRVKISSEAAESISITPVVSRDMPIGELLEMILGVSGKDVERVFEILSRGSHVSGGSRLRWTGLAPAREDIESALARLPDAEPGRTFDPQRCARAVLRGTGTRIDLPRSAATRRRLLHRHSFWEQLLDVLASEQIAYVAYSYSERADVYRAQLGPAGLSRLRQGAGLLAYTKLEQQVRSAPITSIDLFVER